MTNKRRFSLENDFMNFDSDDLLYGFMRSISTTKPIEKNQYIEYLSKQNYAANRKLMYGICGTDSRGLNYRLKRLIKKGLVKETQIENEKGEKFAAFVFPQNYNGIYKLISVEMLQYLVASRNAHAIRIYLYLLKCSTMKDNYAFTIGEIKKAFGYSEKTKTADAIIRMTLESFLREGVIHYHHEIFEKVINSNGSEIPVSRMVLDFIITDTKELKEI